MPDLEQRVQLLERMVASLLLHQHWTPNHDEVSPPIYLRSDTETLSHIVSQSSIFGQGLSHYHNEPWWGAYQEAYGKNEYRDPRQGCDMSDGSI